MPEKQVKLKTKNLWVTTDCDIAVVQVHFPKQSSADMVSPMAVSVADLDDSGSEGVGLNLSLQDYRKELRKSSTERAQDRMVITKHIAAMVVKDTL